MRLSYNWLKDFVKIDLTPEQLAEQLTMLGFEIEKIESSVELPDKVVIGQILTILPHPNADRLQLTTVDIGSKVLNIVCGAPNIAVGQKIPVALVGARLTNKEKIFEIRPNVIRGSASEGMLCAEDELGLGSDHSGIMILDADAPLGHALKDALPISDDSIYVLDVPANRGDVWSHLGMAREIAAVLEHELRPKFHFSSHPDRQKTLRVKIAAPELCPKYLARVITNLKIAPSPDWLCQKLSACGVRPINNLVDITNYVMLELGQPLHAFDRRLVTGDLIEVRTAISGEKMLTLDEKERALTPDMLLIANSQRPMAIAGIMGGEDSGIKDDTTEIILESAQFNRSSILKTSRALGLRSESSARFERGIGWSLTEMALERATELFLELAGGEVVQTVSHIAVAPENPIVGLSSALLDKLLGIEISIRDASQYLKSLGFDILARDAASLKAQSPDWRQDVSVPADLVEEIGRLYGYQRLEPRSLTQTIRPVNWPLWCRLRDTIHQALIGCGFDEVYNYSFHGLAPETSPATSISPADYIEVLNPFNPDQKYLRRQLAPRLRQNLELNLKNFDKVTFFETGRVFEPSSENLPTEKLHLALAAGGYPSTPANFQVLKSALDLLRQSWPAASELWEQALAPDMLEFTDSGAIWELNLEPLLTLAPPPPTYRQISSYPPVSRDLSLTVPKSACYQDIYRAILSADPLISSAELFDVFEHAKLGADKRGLSFHLRFQAADHTLTMDETETAFKNMLQRLKKDFQAEIRA